MTYPVILMALSLGLFGNQPASQQLAANSPAKAPAPRAAPAAKPAPEKTYCTSGTISGSRIVKQECKTKSEWAREGVDINDLLNGQE
jgi:hypothetical protein